jgi:hypothetical protein
MLKIVGLLTAVLLSAAAAGWIPLAPDDLPAPPSGRPVEDGGCMAYDAVTDLIFASKGNETGDFYAYDVNAWTWLTKTGIPLGAEGEQVHEGSVICSDANGRLYLTKGNNTVGFWVYDAMTGWKPLKNVPLEPSGENVNEGAGLAFAYSDGVGYVYLLKGHLNEFYRYDPVYDRWTPLDDAPGAHKHWGAGSWLVSDPRPGSHTLYAFNAKYHELYTYDTDAEEWNYTAKAQMPFKCDHGNNIKAKEGSCAAWYDGYIYALKGNNTTEFWRYDPLPPPGGEWLEQDRIPPGSPPTTVGAGGALAGRPGTGVYALKGNNTLEFWRFTPDGKAGAPPRREGIMAGSSEIGSVSFAIGPNPLSGGLATVRYGLPKAGAAELSVYNVAGQRVIAKTLALGRSGCVSLDLRQMAGGVYLVKLQSQDFTTTQKLVVQH